MEAQLQQRIQRYGWDRAVECYEGFWAAQLAPAQRRTIEMAALASGQAVLDVACGTGLVSIPAARCVGDRGLLVGTDISERMVAAAREAARRAGIRQAVFERMPAEALDLPDETFDAALCVLGLMYVTDFGGSIREMHRVLRPGGRAVVAVWGRRSACGWAEIFPIVDARVRTDVCPLFFQLGTGDTLAMLLREAGFVGVELERLTTTLRYDSVDDALGAAFAGGPVALAYSRFDAATREAAHQAYVASIEPYASGSGYLIPGEFVLARGIKE